MPQDRRHDIYGDGVEAFTGEGNKLGHKVRTLADMGNPSLDVGRKLEPEELLQVFSHTSGDVYGGYISPHTFVLPVLRSVALSAPA